MKMKELSLIEYLAYQLNLDYISDLRFSKGVVRKGKLKDLLNEKIEIDDFEEKDWLYACEYISGERKNTKEEARQFLLEYLSHSS